MLHNHSEESTAGIPMLPDTSTATDDHPRAYQLLPPPYDLLHFWRAPKSDNSLHHQKEKKHMKNMIKNKKKTIK